MPPFIDLTGQRFGEWTVVSLANLNGTSGARWNCKCACGNTKSVQSGHLRSGNTVSCGCARKRAGLRRRIDLTGQKFGELTVTGYADRKGHWACQCSCGKTTAVHSRNLRIGKTKSCGCQHWKRNNRSQLAGLKFGRLTVEAYQGNSRWLCRCSCGSSYIATTSNLVRGLAPSCGCLRSEKIRAHNERKLEAIHKKVIGKTLNGRRCEAYVGRNDNGARTYRFICEDCGIVTARTVLQTKMFKCRCSLHRTPHQQKLRMSAARMRNRFNTDLNRKGIKKNGKTFALLGYTKEQLLAHIEAKFLPGMTWENRTKWHIDHIVPLARAKTHAEIIKLFALKNLQPLWASDNQRKQAKSMAEWGAEWGEEKRIDALGLATTVDGMNAAAMRHPALKDQGLLPQGNPKEPEQRGNIKARRLQDRTDRAQARLSPNPNKTALSQPLLTPWPSEGSSPRRPRDDG